MNTRSPVGLSSFAAASASPKLNKAPAARSRWLTSSFAPGLCLAGLAFLTSVAGTPTSHAALSVVIADAADLTGHWEGAVTTPGGKLEFLLNFTSNSEGTIAIPVQKIKDVPLEKIAIDPAASPATATFKIKQVSGIGGDPTFAGKFSDNGKTISGDFTQGGGKFPFEIKRSADPAKVTTDLLSGFSEFVEKARADWKVPGVAVAIIKGGEVVYAKGFGFRDVDQKLPVSENTLFAIGSATKAFTTFVMGQLSDEGKLDFDKPVTTYIPEFRLFDKVATERMTPRDLVTHRSGLPRHDLMWYGNAPRTRDDMVHRLAFLPNNKDFRETWQYNNLMFMSAGFLEERLTGKTWEENIRERIFLPLNMKRSTLNIADMKKDPDFAFGYRQDEDTDAVERMEFRDISTMGPAGSINSSVTEMANWVKLHLGDGNFGGKQLIKPSTLTELHTPQMTMGDGSPESPEVVPVGYAMGWFVDVYRGHRRVHHGGNIDGFSALVTMVPQDDVGVVVLTNMNGTGLTGIIVRHALDRMLKLDAQDWNANALTRLAAAKAQGKAAKGKLNETRKQGTHPSHPIADYAGDYEHPGYGIISVSLDNSSSADPALSFTFNAITTPLEHWHYDVFSGKKNEKDRTFESFKIAFNSGLDGEIDSLTAQMESSEDAFTFKRLGDKQLSDPAVLAKFAGDYSIDEQKMTFSVSGKTLTASIVGQPTYDLEPARNNTFHLKGLPGFSVQFVTGANGEVNEAKFVQPNGVFVAKRATK